MNYKIIDLLNSHKMVSHLFLDCVDEDTVYEIINQDGYSCDNSEVDIKLLVNGKELNIDNFLNHLEEEYFNLVKKAADSLVKKQLSNRAEEIGVMLSELQDKLQHIENNIEWDENLIDYDKERTQRIYP